MLNKKSPVSYIFINTINCVGIKDEDLLQYVSVNAISHTYFTGEIYDSTETDCYCVYFFY